MLVTSQYLRVRVPLVCSARGDSAETQHQTPDPAFKPPPRPGQAAAWLWLSRPWPPPLSGGSDPPTAESDPSHARDLEDTPRSSLPTAGMSSSGSQTCPALVAPTRCGCCR